MTNVDRLKSCSYFVVRYAPNVLRDDGLNIGVLLHCPEERYLGCLLTSDFRHIRRFDPRADRALLKGLQQAFEEQIEEHESDQEDYLRSLAESLSNAIRLEGPRSCLLADPQMEIEEIYARSVSLSRARHMREETRLNIKRRLTAALVGAGAWERIEKRIPAARWTQPGDPFTFDYGYRPNGSIHLIHALSLSRDTQLAKTLVYTLDCIRRNEPAVLTAVVGKMPDPDDAPASATYNILEERLIRLQPLAGIEAFAQSVRHELRI